jgi:molecular chaperone GrpE
MDKQHQEEQDKQKKNENTPEKDPKEGQTPADENSQTDEAQTMVALTFDEYDALQENIKTLEEEVDRLKDGWQRERADFANYKKRVQKDATRSYQDAMTSIVKVFLSVSDDLERALKNQPEQEATANWVNGIELIHQKLTNQLKNLGVERMTIEPGEEFDPNVHEAVTQEDHEEYSDGQIIDVVQPGYRIEDRVIRPAMVRVAR